MGAAIIITILVIALIFTASKWIEWKVATLSVIYYIEKNKYKQPSDEEMKECTGFVVENMVKDFLKKN